MEQFKNIRRVDLETGEPAAFSLRQLYYADKKANRVGAMVYANGDPVALTGTCSGTAIRADGTTVPMTGAISGNTAYVDLIQDCYAIEGEIRIFVKITSGNVTATLAAAVGTVRLTETNAVIDPGTIIPSVSALISAIDDAIASIPADYSDLLAAIAPVYTDLTFPVKKGRFCWQNGVLYAAKQDITTSESWTASHWIAVPLSNNLAERIDNLDSSLDAAQSSLDTMNELPSTETETTGKYLKTNRTIGTTLGGIVVPSSNWNFLRFPVSAGDRFLVTGTGGADPLVWAFSDAGTDPDATEWSEKGCKLVSKGGQNTTLTNALIVAPVDGWALINHKLSDPFSLRTLQAQPLAQQIASLTGMHGIKRLTDYGAVGDGTTDDTAAIKAALTACAGDTLYVPPGTYLFSETLDIESGTRIIGFGATSKFKLANTFSLTPYPWRTGDPLVSDQYRYPMICMDTDTEGIILENFALEGQTNAFYDKNCDGLTIRGKNHIARNLVITKINFFPADFAGRTNNGVGRGINVQDASVVQIENCTIDECGYQCMGAENADTVTFANCLCTHALQTAGQVHRNCTGIRIIGNTFDNTDATHTGSSAARVGLTLHAAVEYPMNDVMIDNNYIKSAFVFANGGGENNIKITNNRIMGGISLNAITGWRNRCTVIGNTIGAQLNLKSDNAIIAGNMVYHAGGGYMINASGNNVICYGNIALNSTTTAIKVANHDGTSATASNMKQIGIAADGTPIT